ncbi:tyrosine-type recombinase/integrase [Amycolatopsis sp. NPDC003861]
MTALALATDGLDVDRDDELWAAIDPQLLDTLSWDDAIKVLTFPRDHPILGWTACKVSGCEKDGRGRGNLCAACALRWQEAGTPLEEFLRTATPRNRSIGVQPCAVPGCQRPWKSKTLLLCDAHHWQRARHLTVPIEEFVTHPRVTPYPSFGPCSVAACTRDRPGNGPHCKAHQHRAAAQARQDPRFDPELWSLTASAIPEVGKASLRGLPARVIAEVLYGIQERARTLSKVHYYDVRALCDRARLHGAASLDALSADVLSLAQRKLRSTFLTAARRADATPETECQKDVWDLAVFGQGRTLTFTEISQPWLREATKRWAVDTLPKHRGRQVASVLQSRINALALLSESLRLHRDDHGLHPAELSRQDITTFCNRLAYLMAQGTISANRRVHISRYARGTLDRMRKMGLVRPGEPLENLPADFALADADIPDEPEDTEAGRDLPNEVMRHLCEHLPALEAQASQDIRTATELIIDTGRRPHEICSLNLDCLDREDGKPVLIYDNHKANRKARRLPIPGATAALIIEQQERVRARFPHTPPAELKLFPSTTRNPEGRTAATAGWLGKRHRDWVDSLPEVQVPTVIHEGGHAVTKLLPFDKAKIFPYAYRHTYAQRHADAGVDVVVLKELMDHRQLSTTQGYYRVGEERRREAVERVTTMQFDRHGNRIWRQAKALLDSEHLRRAVGEIAVPYGGCSEPSNVAADGQDCPLRFRCIGCGHFSTDISYLPDLERYLADLLRHRERLAATLDADEWARDEALPSDQEITRIRRLINRMKGDLDELTDEDRAQIEDAVAVVRRNRSKLVSLGMPRIRQPLPDLRPERTA